MNKTELIRTISRELDIPLSQDKITQVLDTAVEITKCTLATGESVKWSGFGSFVMKDIPPRRFYSARLGEYTTSKGTKRITFVPSRPK
ncbi:HU family DNA-binding protein [uncultured Bacteroides sp.]|uniref:HU family DNA-binding protein n=1 Tax=uncultured Bacteroides sp. TaxID=162156 RepID=UPI0026039E05|nr:HU family DNA-binding protein [uncultured Bacteroides sp.]